MIGENVDSQSTNIGTISINDDTTTQEVTQNSEGTTTIEDITQNSEISTITLSVQSQPLSNISLQENNQPAAFRVNSTATNNQQIGIERTYGYDPRVFSSIEAYNNFVDVMRVRNSS